MRFKLFHLIALATCIASSSLQATPESTPLLADANNKKVESIVSKGVVVDLRDPILKDGVLTTTKGGTITGSQIRIQAQKIVYTRKMVDGQSVFYVEAEDNLMVEYGDRVFVGTKIEYDFNTEKGIVHDATTVLEPWYLGGKYATLEPDGSYHMKEGYITTCENKKSEWQVRANDVHVPLDDIISASNIQIRFLKLPLFWIPSFKGNVRKFLRAPVTWKFHFGGTQGSRVSMRYRFLSQNDFNAYLRVDYRFSKGLGGGVETEYKPKDSDRRFFTRNYVTSDSTLSDDRRRNRYRFQGKYEDRFFDRKVTLDARYDKLSDGEMPSDFQEKDFEIETAQRTDVDFRRLHKSWILSLFASIQVNDFQTLKQELPTLQWRFRPRSIGNTGIITDNTFTASFLDFAIARGIGSAQDYHSTRLQTRNSVFRPFNVNPFTITPSLGFVGVHYGNSAENKSRWVGLGTAGLEVHTLLSKQYAKARHTARPYLKYEYHTEPQVSPDQHYIFDLNDALSKYSLMKVGVKQAWIQDTSSGRRPIITADVHTNAFFSTHSQSQKVPKVYANLEWAQYDPYKLGCDIAWDFDHSILDHYNLYADWTKNENIATRIEYRTRSQYAWRKAHADNFILESFRSDDALANSALSDQRSTVLAKVFYRFAPNWVCQLQSRHGMNRTDSPNYNEYQLNFITYMRCNWRVKFSLQSNEEDTRVSFNVRLGSGKPNKKNLPTRIWP